MKEELTEELLKKLLSKNDVECFVDQHTTQEISFCDYLNELKDESGLSKIEIIKKTNLNETHGYQIFSGDRGASRDKILQLALAMSLDVKTTNRLLHSAGLSDLYCKSKRDAIIIYCLNNKQDLQKTDEQLYQFGEQTLSDE